MKIIKFKKISKEKYKVYLDNGEFISLFEDVIINNNLLLSKELDETKIKELLNQNNSVYVYAMALRYISVRMRSIKEIKEYLTKKEINNTRINETVDKLIKEGYLNDFKFAKAYTNDQLVITNKGPLKIEKELLSYGIDKEIIEEVMSDFDEFIIKEKLSNLMEKQIKIKKGSLNSVKIKIINYFNNLGYDRQMILNELSKYNLKSDLNKLQKDFNKLYNKYKSKYEKSELKYVLIQKLYAKGYTSSDIEKINLDI